MNRLILSILAVGLTTGCVATSNDGTYIIFYTLTKNTANPDSTDIGVEDRSLGTVATTSQGTLVMDWGGSLMTGERGASKSFSVGQENGTDTSGEDCTTKVDKNSLTCDGLFTKDGGITATVQLVDKLTIVDCDGWDDTDETFEYEWELTGVMINANDGSHLGDDANWGYTPTPVY